MKKNMTPVIGIISGTILIIWSITSSGDIVSFIDIPSLVITIVGSVCGLMVMFPMEDIKKIPSLVGALLEGSSINGIDTINLFLDMSKKARTDGILSLEDEIETIDNKLVSQGLQMVIDGMDPDAIREILELNLAATSRRHEKGQAVFEAWGELAPAFGMLGTLVGLVLMLTDLDDPSAIGVGMATALLTTFYGSFFANLIFLPIAANLGSKTDEEMFIGQMIIEGVLEIQSGGNSRLLEDKLVNFLSPQEQEEYRNGDASVGDEKAYG